MELCKQANVTIFKEWLEENNQYLPEGSVIVQSSSGQVWPYPALLYGRGNWPAVDLLFTLPDVPMTFLREIDGEAYRIKITNIYESRELPSSSSKPVHKSKSLAKLEV